MSIEFATPDTRVRVSVAEVDRATCETFTAQLSDGLCRYEAVEVADRPRTNVLVIDLTEVRFLDSSGVRALIEADMAATRLGGRLVVIGAQRSVRRTLDVVGVLERMEGVFDGRSR